MADSQKAKILSRHKMEKPDLGAKKKKKAGVKIVETKNWEQHLRKR